MVSRIQNASFLKKLSFLVDGMDAARPTKRLCVILFAQDGDHGWDRGWVRVHRHIHRHTHICEAILLDNLLVERLRAEIVRARVKVD